MHPSAMLTLSVLDLTVRLVLPRLVHLRSVALVRVCVTVFVYLEVYMYILVILKLEG